ncbi:MAG: hypothetical protein DRJ18_00825 [Candidatus Methanomethylicota archaeon]|nr:hypothetical protein [Candidatus Culexmicrobium cathedralense]RLE48952.1 MAG: hypothetical protein DRJ18_00825 [Candidatus Verstraetearchaeota archaeon]
MKDKWQTGILVICWLKNPSKLTRRKVISALIDEQTGNLKFLKAVKSNLVIYAARNMKSNEVEKRAEKALTLKFKVPVKVEALPTLTLTKALNEALIAYKELKSR